MIILEERTNFATGTHEGDITDLDIRPICLPRMGQHLKVVGKEAIVSQIFSKSGCIWRSNFDSNLKHIIPLVIR